VTAEWFSYGDALARYLFLNWAGQATLVLVAGLGAASLPRLRPATRHLLLCATLGLAALAPITALAPVGRPAGSPGAAATARVGGATRPLAARALPAPLPAPAPQAPAGLGWALLGVWGVVAAGRAAGLAWGLRTVRRAVRRGRTLDRARLADAGGAALAAVEVRESADVSVPSVVGARRPVILLPPAFGAGLNPSVLRDVLLHEIAHARRRDPAFLLAAGFCHALLFWHPLAALVRRRMEAAAEEACDAAVLAAGVDPAAYARTLVTVLERSTPCRRVVPACPLGNAAELDGRALRRRVETILRRPPRPSPVAALAALGALTAGVGVGWATQIGVRPVAPRRLVRRPVAPAPLPAPAVDSSPSSPSAPTPRVTAALLPPAVRPARRIQQPADLGPPAVVAPQAALAATRDRLPPSGRCVVFVLDISTSMRPHQPEAQRQLTLLIESLGEADTFNVLAFAGDVTAFAGDPVAPVESSFHGIQAWLAALPEKSGTRLEPALRQALATPGVTSVVLLSDGEAWQRPEGRSVLLQLVENENPHGAVVREVLFAPADQPMLQLLPTTPPVPAKGRLEADGPGLDLGQ
jgi:beta-lactamase regulating signal transducer with metallopeptidase domain